MNYIPRAILEGIRGSFLRLVIIYRPFSSSLFQQTLFINDQFESITHIIPLYVNQRHFEPLPTRKFVISFQYNLVRKIDSAEFMNVSKLTYFAIERN